MAPNCFSGSPFHPSLRCVRFKKSMNLCPGDSAIFMSEDLKNCVLFATDFYGFFGKIGGVEVSPNLLKDILAILDNRGRTPRLKSPWKLAVRTFSPSAAKMDVFFYLFRSNGLEGPLPQQYWLKMVLNLFRGCLLALGVLKTVWTWVQDLLAIAANVFCQKIGSQWKHGFSSLVGLTF